MARIVRAALLQAEWTGDKESMIEKHEKYAREAAAQGAKVMCFQELFYGPYFCQVQDPQYFSYTEHIPNGPTTKRMQELAKETGMVLIVPMYEEDEQTTGIYYNTAAVIDADGTYLGKYRKTRLGLGVVARLERLEVDRLGLVLILDGRGVLALARVLGGGDRLRGGTGLGSPGERGAASWRARCARFTGRSGPAACSAWWTIAAARTSRRKRR
jgi:hypothetical protein